LKDTTKFKSYFILLLSAWTFIMLINSFVEYQNYKSSIIKIAKNQANLAFLKDSLYRKWITKQGGVYVFKSDHTPPNPYLSNIPNRDITTTDGQVLTLVNPAYMTRQVFEMAGDDVIQGHLTSDKLMNPINKPDEWENKGLKAIASGEKSYSNIDVINGKPYLRFLRPFMTESGCLKCHEKQGYKVGDIRGGISVKVPLDGYYDAFTYAFYNIVVLNFIVWFLGVSVLIYSYLRMSKLYKKEAKLSKENETLLQEMNHRIKNNLQIISSLIDIRVSNTKDEDLTKVLKNIQSRLISMAHMHEMFNSNEDSIGVSSFEYISRLVSHVEATYFEGSDSDIKIECDVDNVVLNATQSISIGLIINELLTNSLKYAFDETIKDPRITISFKADSDCISILYEDNGKGCDIGSIINKDSSYGLILVDSMASKINAKVTYSSDNGFRAEVKCAMTCRA